MGGDLTLTLQGLSYNGTDIGISASDDLKLVLVGDGNAITSTRHGIWIQGDLHISGDSADTAGLTIGSGADGIFSYDPYQAYDEALTVDHVKINVTSTGTTGIAASKSVTITDSVIQTTGTQYGLQGGHFSDGYASVINISNSTVTAKATGTMDRGVKAFEAAPNMSGPYQWKAGQDDVWTAGGTSAPDFSQTYLALQSIHASHPICGATCSHSSAHSDVVWTGVSTLTDNMEAGNYYLTGNVTLSDKWRPADGVNLCLNGYTITQTKDRNTPVIEVQHPNTFVLTDCSAVPGKITHGEGKTGVGVQSYNEFIMYGGEISGNDHGGVGAAGKFTLDGGTIRGNTGLGGVVVSSNEEKGVPGLFTMKSGSIEGNESSDVGGGVWVYSTTKADDVGFLLEGGTIRNNTAVYEGGGICVGGATFTMKGGSVSGNRITDADGNGGGVSLQYSVDSEEAAIYPVFRLSGGEISGNVKGSTANNLYLTAIQKVDVSGTLTGTGKIGVTTETVPTADSPVSVTGTNSGNFSSYFTSDNTDYEPFDDQKIVKLRVKTAAKVNAQTPTITVEPADAAYAKGESAAPLTVSASVTDGGTLSYQWWMGDGIVSREIAGATSNTYTPATDTVGTVEYSCVVTNTIRDNGDGGTKTAEKTCSARITVTGNVNAEYSISLDTTGTHTFTAATVGYAAQTAKTVTVSNTGSRATGVLTVALSGRDADHFTLSRSSITDLAVSGSDTFTVVPKRGLSGGTYTATVTVSGGNGMTAGFDVCFTVNTAGTSEPTSHSHSGGTATCTEKARCDGCGTAYGELAAHTYENGKCTVCKATDPNYREPAGSPQTGDNSNMALWTALLLLSGSAVIALTVVDRRRKNR